MRIVLDITDEVRGQFGVVCFAKGTAYCSGKRLKITLSMSDPKWSYLTMQGDNRYLSRSLPTFTATDYRNRRMINSIFENLSGVFESMVK